MTPVEIGKGRSFKGLARYLLYLDDQAERPEVSERVGWAESVNLDGAAPDRAWRLMTATAMSAEALKTAAGIRKGKPTEKPVYHYSLNFNPTDAPNQAVQMEAVRSSLKALGLDSYQALAVMHRDKGHAHVHVMVNLISPENGVSAASKQPDGRASPLSNSFKKLSAWALKFEREHNLKVTEGRIANQDKRQQGERVEAKRLPRNVFETRRNEGVETRTAWMRRQQDDRRTMLGRDQQAMREAQATEWTALSEAYRQASAARRSAAPTFKQIAAEIKAEMKPAWAALFRRHKDQLREFERSEQSVFGRLLNMAATAVTVARERDAMTGIVAALSKRERQAIITRGHRQETDELRGVVQQRVAAEIERQKQADSLAARDGRADYLARCAWLKAKHDQQWQAMRERWRDYNAERKEAAERVRTPVRSHGTERSREQGQGRGRGMEPG